MRILSIELNNYGVLYGHHTFDLADRGVTIVLGNNLDEPRMDSNGAGKSTLFEALDWCNYGEIPKGDSVDSIVNEMAGKDCWAIVRHELDDGTPLVVKRGRKLPDKDEAALRVWVGDEEITTLDTKETQALLEQHLGMNRAVFHATVLFGQADVFDFCEATDKTRMEILTTVLELDVVDEWLEQAKAKRKTNEQSVAKLTTDLMQADTKLDTLKDQDYTASKEAWEQQTATTAGVLGVELVETEQRFRELWTPQATAESLLHIPSVAEVGPPPQVDPPPAATPAPRLLQTPYPASPLLSKEPIQEPVPPPHPQEVLPPAQAVPVPPAARAAAHRTATVNHRAAADLALTARTELQRLDAVLQRHAGGLLECSECGTLTGPEHQTVLKVRRAEAAEAVQAFAAKEVSMADSVTETQRAVAVEAQIHMDAIAAATQRHQAAVLAVTERNTSAMKAYQAVAMEASRRHQVAVLAVTESNNAATHDHNAACSKIDNEYHAQVQAAEKLHAAEEQARQTDYWEGRRAVEERYNGQLAAAQSKERQLAEHQVQYEAAQADVARCNQRVADHAGQTNPWTEKQTQLEEQLRLGAEARGALQERHDELTEAGKYFDFWVDAFGIKGLKSYILDSRAQDITDAANRVIYQLTGGTYWVRFETQTLTGKKVLSNKTNIRVFRHNRNGTTSSFNYRSWSGGQKRRISLGVALGLASLVATRASKTYDIVIFDEVFKHLDRSGREAIVDMLRELGREKSSVFVIDHDVEFQGAFENRVTMQYLDGKSTILESNNSEQANRPQARSEDTQGPTGPQPEEPEVSGHIPPNPDPRPRRKKRSPARAS